MDLRRQRLIRRLSNAVKHPVTVITAPAGYGKTVLVDQWAAQHDGLPIARVAIGSEDDWRRIAARIDAELPPTEQAILVVDAVDRSSDECLAGELAALLERVPEAMHLVLITRSRAVPVLDRLHGRTDVAFVTAADLAFTCNEVRLLVRAVSGLKLTDAQAEQLHTRTEGMAAGLEVAAIGLREASDPEAYVESFAGDERHLAAFLVGEVLAPQPPALRRFLVQTSVLDRLTGPLCDAVTVGGDGAVTLRRLEHGGIFIRRLPGSREWFTCHPLFRDLLRSELRRGEYGDEGELHTRAGTWWAAHADPRAAARHFIEAGDWNQVIDLADAFGREMYERGRADEVLQWLGALPATYARQAHVGLRRAYLHTMVSESQHATQIVHDLEVSGLSRGEKVAADALRAVWAFFDATPDAAIKAADDALSALQTIELGQLPDILGMTAPTSMAMMAASSRARALWCLGDVGEARRVLTAGVKQQDVYTPWLLRTLSALAMLEAWAGNLRVARTHGVRASAIATRTGLMHHPAMLDTRLALAHVCRERGDQRRAARLMDEATQIAGADRRPHTIAILVTERARWYLAAGQPAEGLAVLERYRAERESSPPPLIDGNLRATEASLLVSLGDIDRAESVLASTPEASFCPELSAVWVQAAVARRDLGAAAERLDGWTVNDLQRRQRLQRDLWVAVVDFEAGDRRRAIQVVSGVVVAAEREGDTRLFLDGGKPVERLLRALVHAAPLPYAQRLVRAAQLAQDPAKGTVLGLSKRELEVACYLPTPLSSAEIAERLFISLNTLKTHLRTIYSKLGATNRREAIQRAEELGIA